MQRYIVHLMTGYCGEDAYEPLEVSDDTTSEEIDRICWDMACDHAESYGHPSEEDEYEDEWLERVDYTWQDYDPDKHDMHRTGGGSFQDEFS